MLEKEGRQTTDRSLSHSSSLLALTSAGLDGDSSLGAPSFSAVLLSPLDSDFAQTEMKILTQEKSSKRLANQSYEVF